MQTKLVSGEEWRPWDVHDPFSTIPVITLTAHPDVEEAH